MSDGTRSGIGQRVHADAVARAVDANRPRLRALALRFLGDPHAADDAVQEACLRALRSLPNFRGHASVGTWLYRITANVCLDELRRRRRLTVGLPAEDGGRAEPDPADAVARNADLAAALAALPRHQREVVLLADLGGLDYSEVGQAVGVPAGTVGSRLHRARRALRQTLASSPTTGVGLRADAVRAA